MNFDERGIRIPRYDQLLVMSRRGPGRPKKLDTAELDKIALSRSANDFPLFQQKRGRGRPRKNPVESVNQAPNKQAATLLSLQKRGRGRPRKNPVESEIQINLKENYISDVKEKLKLLETITNGYMEIERMDKETQKNVEKLCAMIHNSK